jgi:prolyl oligopeptidase
MTTSGVCAVQTVLSVAVLAGATASAQSPAVAPVRPVTDVYFGTRVVDNYRYMENLADPEVQRWMRAQAGHARAQLDAIPGRQALLARIHALANTDLSRHGFKRRGERYFYEAVEPGAPLPKIYYRDGIRGAEHLLIDPQRLGEGTATHFAVDYYEPSWDGKYLAYGISSGGSEASVLHVIEVATGASQDVHIERASEGNIAWRPDNRSFFYMRFAQTTPQTPASERMYNGRTYLHVLGVNPDGDGDVAVFGRGVARDLDVPEGQGTYVVVAPGSRYAIAVANHNLDNNPSTYYVAPLAAIDGARTPWRRFAEVEDGITEVHPLGETLYFVSRRNAPRSRVLATPLAKPDVASAQVIVPETDAILTGVSLAKEGLYARFRDGAVSRIRRVALEGAQVHSVTLPFEGNVGAPVTDEREAGALISVQGWLQAPRLLVYDAGTDTAVDTGLLPPSKTDTSAFEAREVSVVSYDGTRVPLSLIHKKGLKLDGSHPTILGGYGSYGISLEPRFAAADVAWLERDGVLAIAHVRGGGENGDAWHQAGRLLRKPNTILDFIACAEYLVDQRYTVPARLAGIGGSAGGITVGGALTWRPDLFGVILDLVGMSDALRYETEPNGPPNVSEFGSVRTESGFHGLYAMSAYAHVRDNTAYPAVLFSTGANDPRVAPWQMAKMAARVQAATASKRPVLLRVDDDAGHGLGSSRAQRESLQADLWAFALWQMGVAGFQP